MAAAVQKRVLLVEDNPGDARLIQEMLRELPGLPFLADWRDTLGAALQPAGPEVAAIVLLDLNLPDSDGLDTLLRAQQALEETPIVVLTGLDDEHRAVQALQSGAQDYLVKGQFDSASLSRALRYAIERNQIDAMLKQTVRELETRTEEMESFTYSVSHDLKEPLRTLEAFSRFLLEDYSERLDEQGIDYLTRLGAASARLKDMIEELLILSRLGRRPHDQTRVNVQSVIEGIIASGHIGIDERHASIEIEGELPDVYGDLSRVEQVFGNLIGNGLKFNKSDSPRIDVGVVAREPGWVTFRVRDNGIGIAPEYHERIFGVFQRLHLREEYEGSGAGLAIVKRAAEAVGGKVWLESELGAGASFFVRLPAWRESLAVNAPAQEGVGGA